MHQFDFPSSSSDGTGLDNSSEAAIPAVAGAGAGVPSSAATHKKGAKNPEDLMVLEDPKYGNHALKLEIVRGHVEQRRKSSRVSR